MSKELSSTRWTAIHGALFVAILGVVLLCLPGLRWPWYLLIPVAAYAGLVVALPQLRRTAPHLGVGRWNGPPLLGAVALSVLTSAVLVTYHFVVQPDVTDLAAKVPMSAFGNLVLAGLCFSLVNAMLEEVIFRGILYGAIVPEWGTRVAIAATAILFGLAHWQGYPPGPSGTVLAGGYGVALGLLRWWSGGLGLAVACHVCADATIFVLLASV
jgi:membrane protease YdiL (CAAX protease family)